MIQACLLCRCCRRLLPFSWRWHLSGLWSKVEKSCCIRTTKVLSSVCLAHVDFSAHAIGVDAPPVAHPAISRAMVAISKKQLYTARPRMFVKRRLGSIVPVISCLLLCVQALSKRTCQRCFGKAGRVWLCHALAVRIHVSITCSF